MGANAMPSLQDLVAEPGSNRAVYFDAELSDRPLTLWSARPKRYDTSQAILFVFHGAARNGSEYRDFWLSLVDEADILVIAPEFSAEHYPGVGWFNHGNLLTEQGQLNSRNQWTYAVPERLFIALRKAVITRCGFYGLFGHSAGGQFVHRAMALGFRKSVVVAITANAGTYAMPNLAIPFPYGLGGVGLDDAAMRGFLSSHLTVMVGADDVDATSPLFPKEAEAMLQGATRFERAHQYLAEARAYADRLGVHCAWTGVDVVGVGHDGGRISAAAAPIVGAALHAAAICERQFEIAR
jgi:poly(3-hydroxybutyrate) depolymerase